MSELKNCPFCGNLLEIVRKNGSKYVRCISGICIFETARHGYHISDDELIKRCNRRPAEDAKNKEIERLKAALLNIKNRLFERTYLNFGEAAVADWVVRKVNEILSQALIEAIDIHENAYAPNMNDGRMEEHKQCE